MQWEALEFSAGEVPGEAARTAHYRRRLAALGAEGRVSDAKTSDAVGRAHTASLWLALTGMVSWAFAAPQLTRMVLGNDANALESHREAVVEFASRLVATWNIPDGPERR
jgi:hypothetical protein